VFVRGLRSVYAFLPPAHRGARVIGTDALRIVLIVPEPSDGQERKQDNKDDPNINAHQSSPAAALPTNSSLTDGIYFDDLVAQAPERKPVLPGRRQAGEGHDDTSRIGTIKSAPQCGSGKSRSTAVRNYTLLCICKSSKQTGNLPGGMLQTGHTAGQC
jgi:hypothetical protein